MPRLWRGESPHRGDRRVGAGGGHALHAGCGVSPHADDRRCAFLAVCSAERIFCTSMVDDSESEFAADNDCGGLFSSRCGIIDILGLPRAAGGGENRFAALARAMSRRGVCSSESDDGPQIQRQCRWDRRAISGGSRLGEEPRPGTCRAWLVPYSHSLLALVTGCLILLTRAPCVRAAMALVFALLRSSPVRPVPAWSQAVEGSSRSRLACPPRTRRPAIARYASRAWTSS